MLAAVLLLVLCCTEFCCSHANRQHLAMSCNGAASWLFWSYWAPQGCGCGCWSERCSVTPFTYILPNHPGVGLAWMKTLWHHWQVWVCSAVPSGHKPLELITILHKTRDQSQVLITLLSIHQNPGTIHNCLSTELLYMVKPWILYFVPHTVDVGLVPRQSQTELALALTLSV